MFDKPGIINKSSVKRKYVSYQLLQDIVIPVGTVLRQTADNYVAADIGFGRDFTGQLRVQIHADATNSGYFKAVVT